jgi:hypothetical protein
MHKLFEPLSLSFPTVRELRKGKALPRLSKAVRLSRIPRLRGRQELLKQRRLKIRLKSLSGPSVPRRQKLQK